MSRRLRTSLCEHVFWCERNARVILLDLRSDRYLALDTQASSLFPQLFQGNDHSPPMNDLAEALLDRGLLTTEPGGGKDAAPLALAVPAREVTADAHDGRPRLSARDVSAFWIAIGRTGLHLRLLPLFHVVMAARERQRQRAVKPRHGGRPCNLGTCVAIFDRLKPLAFTARDACLFESLAMIEFLAASDVYANWVFGVQTTPFVAHCWVQLGDTVINDTVENVRGFTPIMMV